jgi:hypothetical protein
MLLQHCDSGCRYVSQWYDVVLHLSFALLLTLSNTVVQRC